MKALWHMECSTIRSPDRDGSWTYCSCGRTAMRWVDPQRGVAQVAHDHPDRRPFTRILGFHNAFLRDGMTPKANADWHALHDAVTNAPGYLFDKSNRGCALVVIAPGESSDTSWVTDDSNPFLRSESPDNEPEAGS